MVEIFFFSFIRQVGSFKITDLFVYFQQLWPHWSFTVFDVLCVFSLFSLCFIAVFYEWKNVYKNIYNSWRKHIILNLEIFRDQNACCQIYPKSGQSFAVDLRQVFLVGLELFGIIFGIVFCRFAMVCHKLKLNKTRCTWNTDEL